MQLQCIGSGDAFGSGGKLNTCFHVTGEKANFLIDCGASSLIGLKANNINLNAINTILFTHFHADSGVGSRVGAGQSADLSGDDKRIDGTLAG